MLIPIEVAATPPAPLSTPTTLEEALAVIVQLLGRIEILEEKLRKSSSNSSKPPSSDGPGRPKRQKKKPSGRKQGGQPGHPKQERALLPPQEVNDFSEKWPEQCEHCKLGLPKVSAGQQIFQQLEIPVFKPHVKQLTAHQVQCPGCGLHNRASTTKEERCGYGPRVDAIASTLMADALVTKRKTATIITELFSVPISAASIIAAQTRVSEAVTAPVVQAYEIAKAQSIKNADETGHREKSKRGYLWVLVTRVVVVFVASLSRAGVVAEALLGEDGAQGEAGVLGTDRYSGYLWWHPEWHQFCWAHLMREFVAMSERAGDAAEVGAELVLETQRMFGWWAQVKRGELSRGMFEALMTDLQDRTGALLEAGRRSTDKKTRALCKRLLENWVSLWVFVKKSGVEPTNNASEQAVRHGVLWRKISYGTQSEAGSRFLERILTVRATLRVQGRTLFGYLVQACEAHRAGLMAPSLIPAEAK